MNGQRACCILCALGAGLLLLKAGCKIPDRDLAPGDGGSEKDQDLQETSIDDTEAEVKEVGSEPVVEEPVEQDGDVQDEEPTDASVIEEPVEEPPEESSCEADTQNDPFNCGYCGHLCPAHQNQPVCRNGQCRTVQCPEGTATCDESNPGQWCQTDLLENDENCGACGHRCSDFTSCKNGKCKKD